MNPIYSEALSTVRKNEKLTDMIRSELETLNPDTLTGAGVLLDAIGDKDICRAPAGALQISDGLLEQIADAIQAIVSDALDDELANVIDIAA